MLEGKFLWNISFNIYKLCNALTLRKSFSDILHNEWNGIYLHFVNPKDINAFGYEKGHNKLLHTAAG